MRGLCLTFTLICAFVFATPASLHAAGLNLSWDECGNAGVGSKAFACNTNSGVAAVLVGSVVPPEGINEFVGTSSQVDIRFPTGSVPKWWKHNQTVRRTDPSICRDTLDIQVSGDSVFTTGQCVPMYGEQPEGGYAYDVGFMSPDRARLIIQLGRLPRGEFIPLSTSAEYFVFKVVINATHTTESGKCSDCELPACLVFNSCTLYQPAGTPNNTETLVVNPMDRNFVTWQQSEVVNCPMSTTGRRTTWGRIRSLYR